MFYLSALQGTLNRTESLVMTNGKQVFGNVVGTGSKEMEKKFMRSTKAV